VATKFGVPVTGTLSVILIAKRRGLVPAVRPLLERLQELRFRMSTDLRDEILTSAGEG
jgi:predicted nucleic acid-binding protein